MFIKRWFNLLTLAQQWIAVTLLAVIPLLLALGYAAWALAQQSDQQRQLLATMDNLNKMDAFIHRQLASMERVSRQYMLIGDARFADIYRQRLNNLADYRINLVVTLPSGREHQQLTEILQLASQVGAYLLPPTEQVDSAEMDRLWSRINAAREDLSNAIDQFADVSTTANQQQMQQVQQRLALIGGSTLLATVLLISLSSVAITRPVRRLAAAIHRIGHQQWEQTVEIEGPRNFIALGASLEWTRQQLLASDRQKQAFLHHITHELKTPLAAIMEAESLLRDQVPGPLTQAQLNVLKILHQNARSLQLLIQQLLNYNAIKHSHSLEVAAVNIRKLCEKIRNQLNNANTEGKTVHYEFSGKWKKVPCDRQCLEMILSNLLSNAQRSVGDNGRIVVDWNREQDHWWLSVSDDGPGIPDNEQEAIFKPFYQGRGAHKGHLKGSGMGLAIVRECVLRLKGNIQLESVPNQRTTFTIRFPVEDQHYHEAA